jgi:hypothetical protein
MSSLQHSLIKGGAVCVLLSKDIKRAARALCEVAIPFFLGVLVV